jgi:predicted exporter
VLRDEAEKSVLTSKGVLLAGGWAAVAFALVATSGLASVAASQILLASGAVIALVLARGSRRD